MKKVLFVLMFAAVAFIGCKAQEQAVPAPETTAPAAAPADNAAAAPADNAAAPAAPAEAGK
jgi:hypothetical protein